MEPGRPLGYNARTMQNQPSFESKSGTQDKIEGTTREVVGKFKVIAAKAVGNPRLEAEGNIDQVVGNAQKAIGNIKKGLGA
jgi:uncharacterized protein YjbJ (UPF0337 family)